MVRLIWRTDVHLSDRAPASRKDDWAETVFAKLEQNKQVARKAKATAVIDGGDFFHVKSPSRNTHELVRRVAEHHATYPCPVYCTPGNHDSVYGDYAFLGQQPLGVLFSTGVFQRLYDEYEVFFGPADATSGEVRAYPFNRNTGWTNGNPFLLRDVYQGDTPIVRVVGIPYHGTTYDMERFRSIKKGEEDYLVCVAHVLASAKGGTMFEAEDVIKYADLVDLDPDVWCFGHWHKDQGAEVIRDKWFVNVGSLTRGALTQDDMERKPATVMFSFTREKLQVQILRLRVSPAEEVFDIAAKTRAEARSMTMDAFVASVRETLIAKRGQTLEEDVETLEGVPAKVRERAISYLEKA